MRQQLLQYVLQHSQPQENQGNIGTTDAPPRPIRLARPVPRVAAANNIMTAFINRNDLFQLRPKLLRIIQSVRGVGQERSIFTFEEATTLLSRYIISRKHIIFDDRNIKVAIIHNDPLGEAFGVRAFQRIQVSNLLRSQLLPVTLTPVPTTGRYKQFRVTPRISTETVTLRNDNVRATSVSAPRTPATNPTVKNWMIPRQTEDNFSPILGREQK